MRLFTGTSGFSYPAWKGRFYPTGLPARRMLAYYASRLATVEVNSTFRRVPKPETLAGWSTEVGPDFVFALKAPQRITHVAKLIGAGSTLEALLRAAAELEGHLGPVLFQLPPTFAADLPRLDEFLQGIPRGLRVAFEFRHDSWFRDGTYGLLAQHGAALCIADAEERSTPFVSTARFGYLRLRLPNYTDLELGAWLERVATSPWSEAFAFFKHEDEARGPELALRFRSLLEGTSDSPSASDAS